MKSWTQISLVTLVLCLMAIPAMADSPRSIVGTWAASLDGAPASFFTFNQDGTLTAAANTAGVSGGHGVWVKTGPRSYVAKNVGFLFGAGGQAELILESQFDFIIDHGGNNASSPNIVITIKSLDGTVLSTSTASSTLVRVTLD